MPTPQEIAMNPGMNPQNVGIQKPRKTSILVKSAKGVVTTKLVETTIDVGSSVIKTLGKIF